MSIVDRCAGVLSSGNAERDMRSGRDHHGDVSAVREDAQRALYQAELRPRWLRGGRDGIRGGRVLRTASLPVPRCTTARRGRTLSA